MRAIIVHGGAGKWREEDKRAVLKGLEDSILYGFEHLLEDKAVSACEKAIIELEDNPIFNAGTGSVLSLDGVCEMDAGIMKGATMDVGAIAMVSSVKNPISLARKVMEETDYVLLAGEGAERFKEVLGFKKYNPITERKIKRWKEFRDKIERGDIAGWKRTIKLYREYPELFHGTVGCVVVDSEGNIVAGSSTGGISFKVKGRVGDTPIPGAGFYATKYGGASATGIGECIVKVLLSKKVCDCIEDGLSPMDSADYAIKYLEDTLKDNSKIPSEAGVITLDRDGNFGYAFNTECMPTAFIKEGMKSPEFFGF